MEGRRRKGGGARGQWKGIEGESTEEEDQGGETVNGKEERGGRRGAVYLTWDAVYSSLKYGYYYIW